MLLLQKQLLYVRIEGTDRPWRYIRMAGALSEMALMFFFCCHGKGNLVCYG